MSFWIVKHWRFGHDESTARVVPQVFDSEDAAGAWMRTPGRPPGHYKSSGFDKPPHLTDEEARAMVEALLAPEKH